MDAAPTAAPLLALRGVGVDAGGAPLLAGLDLALRSGECVALRGPSGCGKTTLLRAVAGIEDPAAGAVTLDGRAPDEIGWPAYRRTVVLVAQTPAMLPGSVRTNLSRPFEYRSATAPFPEERAAALLERLAVGAGRLAQAADTLSVGQLQRVALVRALLVRPRVLLLDEPTSALDEAAATAVEGLLAEERRRGLALLVVTHDAAQAARLADRVVDLAPFVAGGRDAA